MNTTMTTTTVKDKWDAEVSLKMTRRQAVKVLHYIEDKEREYRKLKDSIRDALGLTEIHHEMEDGEED